LVWSNVTLQASVSTGAFAARRGDGLKVVSCLRRVVAMCCSFQAPKGRRMVRLKDTSPLWGRLPRAGELTGTEAVRRLDEPVGRESKVEPHQCGSLYPANHLRAGRPITPGLNSSMVITQPICQQTHDPGTVRHGGSKSNLASLQQTQGDAPCRP